MQHNITIAIFMLLASLALLASTTAILQQHVFALSKFFNCTTEIANKSGALTFDDVEKCFNKEFHGSTARDQ